MIACGENHIMIYNDCELYLYGDKIGKIRCDFNGKIKNIAYGANHVVIQNEKNELYVYGSNFYGQLGLGDNKNRDNFEKVVYDFQNCVKNVYCGRYYTIVENEKNELYACGSNSYGQLGLNDKKDRNIFTKIKHGFSDIKYISCGNDHTVIQNGKNEIFACGSNENGQIGFGKNKDCYKFHKIKYDFGDIIKISCGVYHTVIQNANNKLYVSGYNWNGQLGLGHNKDCHIFEMVDFDFGGKIKNITSGPYHTIIQNDKDDIFACGYNGSGQLGLGDNKDRNKFEKVEYNFGNIKNILCGGNYTIIQNEKNTVHICGYDMYLDRCFFKFEKINITNIL